MFTLELKPESVPVKLTSKCPKATGSTTCTWPACSESQCGWKITLAGKDGATKDEENLHACGPNNMTQIKVAIHSRP